MKQVIVLRKDLNMRKGKMVAQGAHASMAAILNEYPNNKDRALLDDIRVHLWLNGRFTKICVSVDNEEELFEIYNKAKEQNIICSLIQDAGFTEFNNVPTYTAVAVGPDHDYIVNKITGKLKLL